MISPEQLRSFSLFAGVAPERLKELAMIGEEIELDEGEYVFREGEAANALYLIVKGSVDLLIALDEEKTKHVNLSTVVQGDAVGWSALVEPYVFTMSGVCSVKSTLIKLDSGTLRRLAYSNPEWGVKLMSQLAKLMGERLTNVRVRFASMIG